MRLVETGDPVESLQVYTFDPKNKAFLPPPLYKETYAVWKNIWKDALANEMNVKDPFKSDNFSKQDVIVALFQNGVCVGLFTSNKFNLSSPVDRDDSYFLEWSDSLLEDLRRSADVVLTFENFTISRAFRGNGQALSWKELIVLLGYQRQLEMGIPYMLATPRKNRAMEIIGKNTGAKTLAYEIPYKIPGETVDLIAWDTQSRERVWAPSYLSLSGRLWRNRIDQSCKAINVEKTGERYAA